MCKITSINYIKENEILNNIKAFDYVYLDYFTCKNLHITDYNHPFALVKSKSMNNSLIINLKYYDENNDKIKKLISQICKLKYKTLGICSTKLIDSIVIESISLNSNLQSLKLGNKDDIYYLSQTVYETLKNAGIKEIDTDGVCEELIENFDPIIKFNDRKELINYYTYEDIKNSTRIYINRPLKEEEVNNTKYLIDNTSIIFDYKNKDYDNIFYTINHIKNETIQFHIIIENKEEFNKYLFKNLDKLQNKSIELNVDKEDISIKDYIRYEKMLMNIIKPAINLSPFERYLYSYNITKLFKKYKESDNKNDSRKLYKILDNEYMVCVGYSNLLGDLLNKLGIENKCYSVIVDIGFDKIKNEDIVLDNSTCLKKASHERRLINLIDEKYGINGIYISDPTWDNNLLNDYYNYALMTHYEETFLKRYNYFDKKQINAIYYICTLEDFYVYLNYLLASKNYDKNHVFYDILDEIKNIDYNFYMELVNTYPIINCFSKITDSTINKIMGQIGNHLLSKVNNPIKGECFKAAIKVLYEKCYGYDESNIDIALLKTMKQNQKRQELVFPTRYKIDSKGEKCLFMSIDNKFNIK